MEGEKQTMINLLFTLYCILIGGLYGGSAGNRLVPKKVFIFFLICLAIFNAIFGTIIME